MDNFPKKIYHTVVASIYIFAGIAILLADFKYSISLNYKIVAALISCYGLYRLIRTWVVARSQKP